VRSPASAVFLFVVLFAAAPVSSQNAPDPALWPEPQRSFFQDGPAILLTPEQRLELLEADEAGRERLIREFLDRDPIPETAENELRVGVERRRQLLEEELTSFGDARAQLLFLRGRPVERKVLDCDAAFKPLEIWTYPAGGTLKDLVLYRPSTDEPFRLWLPIDSKRDLYTYEMAFWLIQWDLEKMRGQRVDRFFCPDSERVDSATGIDGLGAPAGRKDKEDRPAPLRWIEPEDRVPRLWGPSSLAAWAREAVETPLSPEPRRLDVGSVDLDFPRRHKQRLVTRVLIPLSSSSNMETTEVQKGLVRARLAVDGIVEHAGKVFETFRIRYLISPPLPGTPAALLLERPLRPGESFVLRLRIKDETSGATARVVRGFRVPGEPEVRLARDTAAAAVIGEATGFERPSGPDNLLLMPPPEEVVLNVWRAETVVAGSRIAKVVFLLDGQPQLTRTRPPYSAEIRLDGLPRERVVRAEGYDAAGELVSWDQIVLNQARGGFRVLITDPARGVRAAGSVLARAEVTVPEDHRIEQVEFRVNDREIATLTQPPWQHEVPVPAEDLVYLTVAARLEDGSVAEDVRFLRAPANLDQVRVELVELFATALDGSGHPVQGLDAGDFTVLEGGKPQKVVRFEAVDNLPLSLGIAIDTSFSMASSLTEAQRAAAGFAGNLLTPRDRCFVLSFGGRPELLLPPVDDAEAVALHLEGLGAFGRTALYDGILASLYYFRAQKGQRALVLLTDGEDTVSGSSWEDALEYARRSGVTVYTIGIADIGVAGRSKLAALAEATGGRAFFIDRAAELAGVYGQIEKELRSRYLLAYYSERPADKAGLRDVEVKVKRGLKARVSRGISP
jgi:Ca-activated chloride channel homolog